MEFVVLVGALGMIFLVSVFEQRVERERRRVTEARPGGAGHDLSHYELAYLSGGPRRAINTALAVLATAGAVRVSRGSLVTPVHGAPPSMVPIEQAVLDTLATRPGGWRASELRRAVAAHPALTTLAGGLEWRGLMVPEHALDKARRRLSQFEIAMGLVVGYTVLALILNAFFLGLTGLLMFLALLVLLGIAVVNGFAGVLRQRRRLRSVVTRAGREVLNSARRHYPREVRDQSSLAMAVGIPVALYGLADAGDQTLCDELSAGDPGADCVGSCGSYSGGDGGTTFGSDSYGGLDFGSSSSSCGSSSSSCSSSSSSCSSSSSGCGGGSSCGSSS